MPALVGADIRVSALHCLELRAHIGCGAKAHVPVVHVVGRTDEYRWRFIHTLGPVNVELDASAVAHRNHQLAVDDRYGLKCFFKRVAPCNEYSIARSAALRG